MIRIIEDENISCNGDDTFTDKCHFATTPTLGEFVEYLLSHKMDEWGTVFANSTVLLGYRHGAITGAHPELDDMLCRSIKLLWKTGGWGSMDYRIEFCDEACQDIQESPTHCNDVYYVFGRWENFNDFPYYVTHEDKESIYEFSSKDEAMAFVADKINENVNISWAICRSKPTITVNPKLH